MAEKRSFSQTPLCDCSDEQKAPKIKKSKYSADFRVIRKNEKCLWTLLNEQRDQPELCDVTLTVGDRHLHAHKDVLMSKIPYFKAMFESGMKETESDQIEIKDIEFGCLEMVIDYVYGHNIKISTEFFLGLVLAADFYQLPKLVKRCMKTFPRLFTKDFDVNDLLPLHTFCQLFDKKQHNGPIEDAIMDNFEAVSMHPDFPNLPFETILRFCEADRLTVKDEEVVLQAICRWLKGNPDRDDSDAKKLLACARLPLLSKSSLKSLLADSNELEYSRVILQLINHATEVKEGECSSTIFKSGAREAIGTTIIFTSMGPNSKINVILYSMCDHQWRHLFLPGHQYSEILFNSGEQICWYNSRNHQFLYRSFTSSSLKIHQPSRNYTPARFDRVTEEKSIPKAVSNGKSWIFGNVHNKILTLWKSNSTLCTRIEGIESGTMLVYLDEAVYIIGGEPEGPVYNSLHDVLMVKAEDISVKEQVQPMHMAPMIYARDSPSAVAFEGKIYVCGRTPKVLRDTAEVYDPQKNEWELFPCPSINNSVTLSATKSNLYALTASFFWREGFARRTTPIRKYQFERYDKTEKKWVSQEAFPQENNKKKKRKEIFFLAYD